MPIALSPFAQNPLALGPFAQSPFAQSPFALPLRDPAPRWRSLRHCKRCAAAVALGWLAFSATSGLAENAAPDVREPAEIDRAVSAFTGAKVGEVGGARAAAARRLRLAACATPLTTQWHGTRRNAVKVECTQTRGRADPWRIFVATRPAFQSAPGPASAVQRAPSVSPIKRGDPITVIVRGRGFSVQQAGEATENGHVGDWIGVRTARQAEPVRARIERPGLAIIPMQ